VAEVGAETAPVRIAGTPFSWSVRGAAGWFDDETARVSTVRTEAQISLRSDSIAVAPHLTLDTDAALRVSAYGTGATRTLTTAHATLTRALDTYTAVRLGYTLRTIGGVSPLVIDHVELESTFSVGVSRVVPDRYRVAARVGYNTLFAETTVTGTIGYVLSPSWEIGVSAIYNFRLAAFEDVDYTIRRICDCVDVVVRYRQIRREVSIEFGLLGFAERGAPFVPRSNPRPPAVEPAGEAPQGGDQR
jgi:hypothetical protein